ncbi:MAG TPA: hypoxanthine phosphoribosyltransferase [Candidatus Bilophila faecipullorum]|uniref:Hypoxanthine phosphoribosyltransferase n=1 Tax=Candidatus Bilophila faecipullorum TaxID=2838482 RepID=A0A9D1U9G6_9BACT|nr:hypoxanthine phosphoribosyltransferase [uncultured Bilophila sp.]HIW78466.1 hypoxanthine phosphoribosyltransferase [Candidatus Bilophila faecipullorum]
MTIKNLVPLIDEEAIQRRILEMAEEINAVYKDEPLVVVCVLKGAFMFFSDLVRHLTCRPEIDFVRLASYGSGSEGGQTISFTKDVEIPLKDKHVLIVEDIVDTGHTMDFLMRQFRARGARSLRLAVLIDKNERREVAVTSHFVGFALPGGFIVGYGLDYAETCRELPALYEAELEA